MNSAIKGLLVLFLITGGSGCVSSYKHVLVRVVDSNTGKPISGATVSTSYISHSAWSRASRRMSKAVTDGTGSAVLLANYLPAEPTFFGVHGEVPFEPVYDLTISNDLYEAYASSMTSLEELADRPGGFVPTKPDITFKITSKKDSARFEAEAKAKRVAAEQAADRLFRESPDFWPEHNADPLPFPTNDTGWMLVSKRWKHASKTALGTKADVDSIRSAVIRHMKHPRAKVHEVRWVCSTTVMVFCGWYTSPLAAAGYTYVLRKTEEGWTVIAYYMNFIS